MERYMQNPECMGMVSFEKRSYENVVVENPAWREISKSNLTIQKVLGAGQFGEVARGELLEDDGRKVICAVKTIKGKHV